MTIPTLHTLEPAYSVVERLGGKSNVAEALELDRSTISRWCQPRPQGTGGQIPQRYWAQLMTMARQQGVTISLEELAAVEV